MSVLLVDQEIPHKLLSPEIDVRKPRHAVCAEYMAEMFPGELTKSRETNEGRRRVHAHYRYYAG